MSQPWTINYNLQATAEDHDLGKYMALLQKCVDRMMMSHYKYGNMSDKYPHSATGIANAAKRLELYAKSGNVEDLLDAANFLLIEAVFPSHDKSHFRARGAGETSLEYGGTFDKD